MPDSNIIFHPISFCFSQPILKGMKVFCSLNEDIMKQVFALCFWHLIPLCSHSIENVRNEIKNEKFTCCYKNNTYKLETVGCRETTFRIRHSSAFPTFVVVFSIVVFIKRLLMNSIICRLLSMSSLKRLKTVVPPENLPIHQLSSQKK